ncbi:YdcH family protein [Sphingobium nicotianae]|uniref:DUF465 domain-containing protein n=1 Tax=Sphingobium nicotianae TaxID=2782607 RepID=A0A9X1AIL6_9SPHN|nr:DUF465 domain-containing protein [Sphingobium nicotianae]MBT2185474.1 DUF465 domain-containing protein [Sphingobium nicotianae]
MTLDTRQTLHSLFADHGDALHALKLDDAHFRALAERHDALSKEIHRIETEIEPASDDRLELLKKERLAVLDEISGLIARRN